MTLGSKENEAEEDFTKVAKTCDIATFLDLGHGLMIQLLYLIDTSSGWQSGIKGNNLVYIYFFG
jgi:hypothetical protein